MNLAQHRPQGHHQQNGAVKPDGNLTLARQSKIAKAKDLLNSLSSHQVAALKDLGFDLVSIIPKLENPLLTQSDIDYVMKSNKTCEDIVIDEKAKKFLFKFPKDLGFRALGEFKNRMEERVNKDDVRDPNRFLMGILNRYWNMKPQSLQQTFRLEEHITKLIESGDIKKGVIDAKLKDFLENMDTDDAVKCLNEYVYEIMKGKSVRNHSAYLMGICKRCFTAKQKKSGPSSQGMPSDNVPGIRNSKPKSGGHHNGSHHSNHHHTTNNATNPTSHSMQQNNNRNVKPKTGNGQFPSNSRQEQSQQYRSSGIRQDPEPFVPSHNYTTNTTTPHNAFSTPYTLAVQQQDHTQDHSQQRSQQQPQQQNFAKANEHAPLFCPPPSMSSGTGIWAYRPPQK
eukprot:g2904.t1